MDKQRIFRALVCFVLICALVVNISPIRAKAVDPVTLTGAAMIGLAACLAAGVVILPQTIELANQFGASFEQQIKDVTIVNVDKDTLWDYYIRMRNKLDNRFSPEWDPGEFHDDLEHALAAGLLTAIASILCLAAADGFDNGLSAGSLSDVSCWFPSVTVDAYGKKYVFTGITDDQVFSPPVAFRYSDIGSDGKMFYCINVGFLTNVAGVYRDGVYVKLSTSTTYSGFYGAFYSATCHEDFFDSWDLWNQYPLGCVDLGFFNLNEGSLSDFLDPAVANSKIGIVPDIYIGDIPQKLKDGEDDPEKLNLPPIDPSKIFTNENAQLDDYTNLVNQFKNGELTYDEFVEQYQHKSTTPDPSTPSEPVVDPSEPTEPEDVGPIGDYALDLTEFFPFCIPYDIKEFLSLLSAAPEAPVFEWDIVVTSWGWGFHVTVDLSPWNDVAALFRKLELLAFIVGLGFVTREKFLRG